VLVSKESVKDKLTPGKKEAFREKGKRKKVLSMLREGKKRRRHKTQRRLELYHGCAGSRRKRKKGVDPAV